MDVVAPLVPDFQPMVAVEPRARSFYDPAVTSQPLARLDAAAGYISFPPPASASARRSRKAARE